MIGGIGIGELVVHGYVSNKNCRTIENFSSVLISAFSSSESLARIYQDRDEEDVSLRMSVSEAGERVSGILATILQRV